MAYFDPANDVNLRIIFLVFSVRKKLRKVAAYTFAQAGTAGCVQLCPVAANL